MSNRKTAIKLVLDEIDLALEGAVGATCIGILHGLRSKVVALLPTERENIEQAYSDGVEAHSDYMSVPKSPEPNASEYHDKTYGE